MNINLPNKSILYYEKFVTTAVRTKDNYKSKLVINSALPNGEMNIEMNGGENGLLPVLRQALSFFSNEQLDERAIKAISGFLHTQKGIEIDQASGLTRFRPIDFSKQDAQGIYETEGDIDTMNETEKQLGFASLYDLADNCESYDKKLSKNNYLCKFPNIPEDEKIKPNTRLSKDYQPETEVQMNENEKTK